MRALAVTAVTRAPLLPNVATVDQFVPGFEATDFVGIGVPGNTHNDIIEKLNKEINASLADTALNQRIAELGETVSVSSPSEFGKYVVEYTDKWARVIRAAGIKAE